MPDSAYEARPAEAGIDPVFRWIPGFDQQDKRQVTVHHLLTHTAALPDAPFHPLDFHPPTRAADRFRQWRVQGVPGAQFAYHRGSGMWALAEVIRSITGLDHRSLCRERIAAPLGLDDLFLGSTEAAPIPGHRVATVQHVGEPVSEATLASMGLNLSFMGADYERYLTTYNTPAIQDAGSPGAGCVTSAATVALFYQGLMGHLHGPEGPLWAPQTMEHVLALHTGSLKDPMTGRLAHRGLGVVLSGDQERVFRGFAPSHSPHAFGHPGVGGQIAWADPETGISFSVLTNGLERNPLKLGMRGLTLSEIAATSAAESR